MASILVFVISVLLAYLIDTLLVGMAFFALKARFRWSVSRGKCFLILFATFAFKDLLWWPAFYFLDVVFTVRNTELAQLLALRPDQPLMSFFDPGFFDLFLYAVQTVVATWVGTKVFGESD